MAQRIRHVRWMLKACDEAAASQPVATIVRVERFVATVWEFTLANAPLPQLLFHEAGDDGTEPGHGPRRQGSIEECVAAFPAGRLRFPAIVETIERVVAAHVAGGGAMSVEAVTAADAWARRRAREVAAEAG